jgi:hypothetical protein
MDKSAFTTACEHWLTATYPQFRYQSADLYGYVSGCWPTDDTPEEIAEEFYDAVTADRQDQDCIDTMHIDPLD